MFRLSLVVEFVARRFLALLEMTSSRCVISNEVSDLGLVNHYPIVILGMLASGLRFSATGESAARNLVHSKSLGYDFRRYDDQHGEK
jgi:hypothetical protein